MGHIPICIFWKYIIVEIDLGSSLLSNLILRCHDIPEKQAKYAPLSTAVK